jgi:hypothetical protein
VAQVSELRLTAFEPSAAVAGWAVTLRELDDWVSPNGRAITCYKRAGLVRADAATEDVFNAEQPRTYAWMQFHGTRRLST